MQARNVFDWVSVAADWDAHFMEMPPSAQPLPRAKVEREEALAPEKKSTASAVGAAVASWSQVKGGAVEWTLAAARVSACTGARLQHSFGALTAISGSGLSANRTRRVAALKGDNGQRRRTPLRDGQPTERAGLPNAEEVPLHQPSDGHFLLLHVPPPRQPFAPRAQPPTHTRSPQAPRHSPSYQIRGTASQPGETRACTHSSGAKSHLAGSHLAGGKMHFARGEIDAAFACFQSAAGLAPRLAEAWYMQGGMYVVVGQPERAMPLFERATMLRPDHPEALFEMGNVLLGRRDNAAAEQVRLLPVRTPAYAGTI